MKTIYFYFSTKYYNLDFSICYNSFDIIGHILRRNWPPRDGIEGEMTEGKGIGRRRTQLFENFRNRRRYWELKEEA